MKMFMLVILLALTTVTAASAENTIHVFSGETLDDAVSFLSLNRAEYIDAVWISSPIVTAVHVFGQNEPKVMLSIDAMMRKPIQLRLSHFWMSVGMTQQDAAITLRLPADVFPTHTSFYHRVGESLTCYERMSGVTVTVYMHDEK